MSIFFVDLYMAPKQWLDWGLNWLEMKSRRQTFVSGRDQVSMAARPRVSCPVSSPQAELSAAHSQSSQSSADQLSAEHSNTG